MKVRIDESRCTGHGRCYATAPDVFDCDDRGYGVAPSDPIRDDLVAQARLAEQNCPESAVILEDA
jgi:ferredoxin